MEVKIKNSTVNLKLQGIYYAPPTLSPPYELRIFHEFENSFFLMLVNFYFIFWLRLTPPPTHSHFKKLCYVPEYHTFIHNKFWTLLCVNQNRFSISHTDEKYLFYMFLLRVYINSWTTKSDTCIGNLL